MSDLVAAMSRPSFYPHGPERVELVETHISWVFLAGERVYKVKKPVVFPFLDYGDAGRRRALCKEEVRLNRRLAQDLYLGVRGLARRDGVWSLAEAEDHAAEEWAVEMRRFDERRTLASLLVAGEVGEAQLAELGRLIARFHRDARVVRDGGSRVEAAWRGIGDNFEALAAWPEAVPERELAAARRFASAWLAGRGEALEERARAGLVRDCHGDLRAEHVVFEERIEVFDCIEFAPHLREIDVAADVAFLVMDVAHAGREDLTETLLAAYREAGGEPGDGPLISFFAAYRAWVRAKVACLRAGELAADDSRRGAALEQARGFAATARGFAWRARAPLLLVVCGGSATGKTHLAEHLAAVSGWPRLSSDVVRKGLFGLRSTERAPADAYAREASERTYEDLGRRARGELARVGGAIVDATFRLRRHRDAFARGVGGAVWPRLFVECTAPAPVLAERAARRAADPARVSDADLAQVEHQQREFEPLDEIPPGAVRVLDTDRPVEQLGDDLEAMLDRRLAETPA